MRLKQFTPIYLCSLVLIVGCAKTEDGPAEVKNTPATQPAATDANASARTPDRTVEPMASMMRIDQTVDLFPPARLRLTTVDGKVVARLYSDDPKDVLTGKASVNSYDLMMTLPDISDPADISKAVWTCSASIEKQDSAYGIFLNEQQDVLHPMSVTVRFAKNDSRVRVAVQGTFSRFHMSEQTPNPAPVTVNVMAILDASVLEK
jgi:hypothetical protein